MNETIYVTGHRHPDSDAICAAITYADLLNRTGKKAVACRQGPLNEETKFILKKFGLENPLLKTDARARICDIDIDKPTIISKDETVHHAWHVMLQTQNRSLVVYDENDKLCGVCTTSNLASVRIHPDTDLVSLMATATLDNIAKTVGGDIVYRPDVFSTNGVVHILTLESHEMNVYALNGGISILSSGVEKQKNVINRGCKCLIITCGAQSDSSVIELAKEKGCAIVMTINDTMHTARVITESYSIEQIMHKDLITFNENEYVEDVAMKMNNSRVRSYPVLNDEGEVVGAISRYHTRNYQKLKVALVDHSAVNQTFQNIDMAEIVAIVDHHHIGDVQTQMPIEYRNHKCGSTCTIISKMYRENGLEPDATMSGLLLSAILSDTLNFKSATTKEEDKETVAWLAKIAGIDDVESYAREMLGASVSLSDATPHDILTRDLKNYEIGKYHFAIGQTNYSRLDEVQMILPQFLENMEREQAEDKLDILVMLFTDVMGKGSMFYFYGPLSYVVADVIETTFDEHSGFDPNIISRKQQLMPKLSEVLTNM
jgi:manganese-dependent inorganic pyrophosphatase